MPMMVWSSSHRAAKILSMRRRRGTLGSCGRSQKGRRKSEIRKSGEMRKDEHKAIKECTHEPQRMHMG